MTAFLVGVLILGWAILQWRGRPAYSCPTCGTKRVDGHSAECPWSSRP